MVGNYSGGLDVRISWTRGTALVVALLAHSGLACEERIAAMTRPADSVDRVLADMVTLPLASWLRKGHYTAFALVRGIDSQGCYWIVFLAAGSLVS